MEIVSCSAFEANASPPNSRSRNLGGWRAIMYILGNESFEKLASMSLIANMTVYLTQKYNLTGVFLTNVINIWSGSTNLTSILGAVASDAYIGRFHTLLWGTMSALLGMAAMTLTAAVPQLRPPHCEDEVHCTADPHPWQLAFLFISLAFISLGAGGIRPCNIAFGADQFDTNTKKGKAQLESFFNWWYFSFTIALIIALAGVVYVQTNISWTIGFAIPTACLVLSITIFWIGRPMYVRKKPQGSVFVDLFKVIAAAYRKRKFVLQSDGAAYYDPHSDGSERDEALDCIADESLNWLNKAALIIDESEVDRQGRAVDSWRLCSVRQVKILKCLAGILPVWITGTGFFFVMDQQMTFGILQSLQMNRSMGKNFTIPPAWMGITSMIALSIWIVIYEKVYIPLAKKILRTDSRLSMQQRITIGIIMSILCMLTAGIVEIRRRSLALKGSLLHVAALLPQYAFSGLTEAFAAVALMEYFTLKLPQTMRSVSGAIFFLTISIASYLSSLVVNVMHSVTGGRGRRPWIGGRDLNSSKLDRYYFLIAALAVMNLLYFEFYARKFVVLPQSRVGIDRDVESEDVAEYRVR